MQLNGTQQPGMALSVLAAVIWAVWWTAGWAAALAVGLVTVALQIRWQAGPFWTRGQRERIRRQARRRREDQQ